MVLKIEINERSNLRKLYDEIRWKRLKFFEIFEIVIYELREQKVNEL